MSAEQLPFCLECGSNQKERPPHSVEPINKFACQARPWKGDMPAYEAYSDVAEGWETVVTD